MGIPATMRALQQTSRNGPQDMRLLTDAPVPSPGTGEVLLRVAAAGVNFADLSKARGTFRDGPRPPYLAGFEAAGEIVAVGGAVTGAQPRAHVVGVGSGAFAEYVVLPAAAAMPVPPGWTDRPTPTGEFLQAAEGAARPHFPERHRFYRHRLQGDPGTRRRPGG